MNPQSRRRALLLASLALVAGPAWGADAAPAAADRPFVVYMGADLEVQQGKRFHRVEDVDGSEFVITVGGKNRFVRTRLQTNNVKVENELKFSPFSVKLDDLQGGGGYTPAADPRHKFNARSGAAAGAAAARDLAQMNMNEIRAALVALAADPNGADPVRKAQLESALVAEEANSGMADYQSGTDFGSIPAMANALSLELAEGNYDMVDISFKISSPEPLDDPYMVVLVEFSLRDAKPGETSQLIHAKALDPIGPEPKYIRIREGGMPVGFKYLRHEVHIYNRGKEVATNVSSKRVELSRDEARQYIVLDHVATHKDATLPPAPVSGSLPASVRQRVAPEQLNRACYARVAKDGQLLGIFADEAASLPLADEELNRLFADALFRPALANGKPMDGVVRVRLADLTL
jgi:hypothetical protein